MSQMPTETQMGGRYEPPINTQFNVFLDNRVGRLMHLLKVFEDQALTLAGFSVLDSTGHAVVRVVTSRSDLARRLLERHDYPFSEQTILCIEIDPAHSVADVCQQLVTAEVSISYAYPLLVRPRQHPVVAMHCDDCEFAAMVLRNKLFTLLGENELGDNATGSAPDIDLN
ncbi:MAG: hypothetical protein ACE37H_08855 [Phycisphaeraceae bacterium]